VLDGRCSQRFYRSASRARATYRRNILHYGNLRLAELYIAFLGQAGQAFAEHEMLPVEGAC
jgi:hypothetical protein